MSESQNLPPQLVQQAPVAPGAQHTPLPSPQPPKKRKRILLWVTLAVVSVLVAMGIVLVGWYRTQLSPKTKTDSYHVITIKPGQSTSAIARSLEEKAIIKSATAFVWHIKLSNTASLQAGSYRLSSKLSTPEIARILADGKVSETSVLIAPGLRLAQIKNILVNSGYTEAEVDEALVAVRDHPILAGVSQSSPLEGYLFPDTYHIGPDTTAEQFIRLMLDTFQSKITPEIQQGLKKQGLDLRRGIILASIVQKEVSDYPNQQKTAQVFLKRLSEGIVLGSDVTFQYAAAETGQASTPELNSPYNTRKVSGLPPTAIANFNIDALRAVANPAKTDYNYFVAGDDGTVYYSKTEAEHESLTRQHCQTCFQ